MEAFALSPDAPRVPLPQRLLSDERLLRLIAAGNAQAFGAVYARYHAPLYAYCRSIVRDPDDARDALQNTMLKALAALNRGQDRELTLKPWLFRIAHNESISLLRRRRPCEPLTDAISPPVAGADRQVVARERLAQLVTDLQELPERQRGALIMREVNGLSYDEIAGALGISTGAARQTVFEARTALTEYGEGREVACESIRRSISDGDGRALRARRVRAHLRACNGCRDFRSTLHVRRRELAILAPGLSAGSVVALLQGVLGAGAAGSAVGVSTVTGAGLLGGSAGGLLATGAAKSVVALVAATAAGAGAIEVEQRVNGRDGGKPAAAQVSAAVAFVGPAAREATALLRTAAAEPTRALAPLDEVVEPKSNGGGGKDKDRDRGSRGNGNGRGNGHGNHLGLGLGAGATDDAAADDGRRRHDGRHHGDGQHAPAEGDFAADDGSSADDSSSEDPYAGTHNDAPDDGYRAESPPPQEIDGQRALRPDRSGPGPGPARLPRNESPEVGAVPPDGADPVVPQ